MFFFYRKCIGVLIISIFPQFLNSDFSEDWCLPPRSPSTAFFSQKQVCFLFLVDWIISVPLRKKLLQCTSASCFDDLAPIYASTDTHFRSEEKLMPFSVSYSCSWTLLVFLPSCDLLQLLHLYSQTRLRCQRFWFSFLNLCCTFSKCKVTDQVTWNE